MIPKGNLRGALNRVEGGKIGRISVWVSRFNPRDDGGDLRESLARLRRALQASDYSASTRPTQVHMTDGPAGRDPMKAQISFHN